MSQFFYLLLYLGSALIFFVLLAAEEFALKALDGWCLGHFLCRIGGGAALVEDAVGHKEGCVAEECEGDGVGGAAVDVLGVEAVGGVECGVEDAVGHAVDGGADK